MIILPKVIISTELRYFIKYRYLLDSYRHLRDGFVATDGTTTTISPDTGSSSESPIDTTTTTTPVTG